MKLFLQLELRDSEHRLKYKSKKQQSKSFVSSFITMLWWFFQNGAVNGPYNWMFTAGWHGAAYFPLTYSNIGSDAKQYQGSWYSGAETGIVVGTGNTAVTATDSALATKINEGISSGELQHSANHFTDVVVSAPNASYTHNRILRNGSGGSITIKETGIYGLGSSGTKYCFVRDVLGTPVTMADGDYLNVTYTFQITC